MWDVGCIDAQQNNTASVQPLWTSVPFPHRKVCKALMLPLQQPTRLLLAGLLAPLSIAVTARGHSH